MIRTVKGDRALIEVDVPAEWALLKAPLDQNFEKWYKAENARFAQMYPEPKIESQEIAPELAELLTAATSLERLGAQKRKLAKLMLRKEMEWAKLATVNGYPVAERRQYHVKYHPVHAYDVDCVIAR